MLECPILIKCSNMTTHLLFLVNEGNLLYDFGWENSMRVQCCERFSIQFLINRQFLTSCIMQWFPFIPFFYLLWRTGQWWRKACCCCVTTPTDGKSKNRCWGSFLWKVYGCSSINESLVGSFIPSGTNPNRTSETKDGQTMSNTIVKICPFHCSFMSL